MTIFSVENRSIAFLLYPIKGASAFAGAPFYRFVLEYFVILRDGKRIEMKKIFLSILGVIIWGSLSFAQVTLLHTFGSDEHFNLESATAYGNTMSFGGAVYEPLDYYFCTTSYTSIPFTWRIYNSSFQLVKEITLPSSISNGYAPDMNVTILGKHLINTDEKIEFCVQLLYTTSQDDYNHPHSYIINEDGEIIYDFGIDNNVCFWSGGIHKVGNQLRAIAETGNGIQIYSLGGNYNPSTMVTYPQQGSFLNPYPNPSRNTISLPYTLQSGETSQLHVFNMNGQLLETFNIGSDFDKILLNVSGYPKGTYIYTYNGVSKKFVVQ